MMPSIFCAAGHQLQQNRRLPRPFPGRHRTVRGWACRPGSTAGSTGSYTFRHVFAERMKDRVNLEHLATIMRTSTLMLENTHGKHSDDSNAAIVEQAVTELWPQNSA